MRIAILGGTGNVGTHITRFLANKGNELWLLNRNPLDDSICNHKTIRWYECDRREHRKIQKFFSSTTFDVVVDLSGYRSVDVEVVLDTIEGKETSYLFISSIAVAPTRNDTPISLPIHEEVFTGVQHKNQYAHEKLVAENMILVRLQTEKLYRGVVVRTGEIIGTNDVREQYFFLRAYSQCDAVLIPDGGHNLVHPVDVRDVTQAIATMISTPSLPSGIYHVAGSSATVLSNVVDTILGVTGINVGVVSVPSTLIKSVKNPFYYPFFPRSTVISSEKLTQATGFIPQYDLQASFEQSWSIFRSFQHYSCVPQERENPFVDARVQRMLNIAEEKMILSRWLSSLKYLTGIR